MGQFTSTLKLQDRILNDINRISTQNELFMTGKFELDVSNDEEYFLSLYNTSSINNYLQEKLLRQNKRVKKFTAHPRKNRYGDILFGTWVFEYELENIPTDESNPPKYKM